MPLPPQTVALLKTARSLVGSLPADGVLLLAEGDMSFEEARRLLGSCKLMVAFTTDTPRQQPEDDDNLIVLDIEGGPTPIQERMSLALLEAVRLEHLHPGADVVVLYNGIQVGLEEQGGIDSLSLIHLGEHLERLTAKELRHLGTKVPLATLRAVVDLAMQIGREGREGQPTGTLLVVGDSRKVLPLCRPMNFNPFRGYPAEERDVRDPAVREQIKDLAKLEGAIIIQSDGAAVAACMHIEAPERGYTLSMGLGTRHAAAAAISKCTQAIAVVVSQSTGVVRLFQAGEVVLHIEPLVRPMAWGQFRLETQDQGARAPGGETG
jgi:DNA integrity scanning protein DisA with diadenylate cyclase activity